MDMPKFYKEIEEEKEGVKKVKYVANTEACNPSSKTGTMNIF